MNEAGRALHVAGVDGWRGGWVAVELETGRFRRARVTREFTALRAELEHVHVLAVDMPIGLLERGEREADRLAGEFLGRARASVFPAPQRAVLQTGDYGQARCAARRVGDGKGLSKQTYNLIPKIRELDAFVLDEAVHEAHPEVSFRVMAQEMARQSCRGSCVGAGERTDPGDTVCFGKKTWAGQQHRRRLLLHAGIELPEDLGDANAVPPDDILDAAACAWTAARIACGRARAFPETPRQHDRSGRALVIWA